MSEFTIRRLRSSDLEEFLALCGAHAMYEGATFDPTGKVTKFTDAVFSATPVLHVWVAVHDRSLIGYMSATNEFSTWKAGHFLHMDCLYLYEKYRGNGLGRALMETLKEFAAESGCEEIQWQTPVDNKQGIGFYNHIGAMAKQKVRYSLQLRSVKSDDV